jgi:hypothetical protein
MVPYNNDYYCVKAEDPGNIHSGNITITCVENGQLFPVVFADPEELEQFTAVVRKHFQTGRKA